MLVRKAHKRRASTTPSVLVLDDESILKLAKGGKDGLQLVLLRCEGDIARVEHGE